MRVSIARILLLLGICFAACLFGLFVSISIRGKYYEGEAAEFSVIKADDKLFKVYQRLPKEAKNIDYFVKPFAVAVKADFDISQPEFKAWAKVKGWDVRELENTRHVNTLSSYSERISVKKGYGFTQKEFKEGNLRSILRVIFDSEKLRCYYRYYTF